MEQINVSLLGAMASDRIIASAAWTSTTNQENKELKTDEQVASLVAQLANEGHGVPFEHCIFRFHITLPIAIDRQLVKHRISSHSGMSGRYRTMPSNYLDVPVDVKDIMKKLDKTSIPMFNEGYNNALECYNEICEKANNYYNYFMTQAKNTKNAGEITNEEYKRFREFYRGLLPQHNMTETVLTINLRSLANFIKLRLDGHAQPEIQEIAKQMLNLVKENNSCPAAIKALENNGWRI